MSDDDSDTVYPLTIALAGLSALAIYFHSNKQMKVRRTIEHFKMIRDYPRAPHCPRTPCYNEDGVTGKDDCIGTCPSPKMCNVCEDPLGEKVVFTDRGANCAFQTYLSSDDKSKNQIGLLLNAPSTTQYTQGLQSTGVNQKNFISASQKLCGPANPKTLVAPVIPARSHDIDYWRTNNPVIRSGINDMTPFDAMASGYKIQPCLDKAPDYHGKRCYQLKNTRPRRPPCTQASQPLQPRVIEGFEDSEDLRHESSNVQRMIDKNIARGRPRERIPELTDDQIDKLKQRRKEERQTVIDNTSMDIGQAYNQAQLATGLPTNFPSSRCGRKGVFEEQNDDVFTATVAPGIYQNSQIIEPINALEGVSITTQFPPTTTAATRDGGILYEQHDPNLYQAPPKKCVPKTPNTYNVTDPRFTGYGTSYREYLEPMTGQSRFYYKDVDAVKMPNYICRSKIDCNPWADKYGTVPAGDARGNKFTENIRTMANNAFLDATIEQRTELMQRLMRKKNANAWQQKMFPISTNGQAGNVGACRT